MSVPWIGTVLGIAGIVLGFYFYIKGKRSAGLSYQIEEFSVVGESDAKFPAELEIVFAGDRVERVTASKVIVWNSGNVTIDGADIVSSDPLRVETAGGIILKARFLRVSREVNGVTFKEDKKSGASSSISFDYLDPNDGFVLTVVHSAALRGLSVKGTLKGLSGGLVRIGSTPGPGMSLAVRWIVRRNIILRWIPFSLGVLFVIGAVFTPELSAWIHTMHPATKVKDGVDWSALTVGALYIALPVTTWWFSRRRYPANLLPKQSRSKEQAVVDENGLEEA